MICIVLLCGIAPVLSAADLAPMDAPETPRSVANTLTLEAIETQGNTRTSDEIIHRYLGLTTGAAFDQAELLDGINRLRGSELFESVDYYTRPGHQRGALVLVLDVVERGMQFKLGTGNTGLDGWYFVPAALSFDNLTGRGEDAALQIQLGYRTAGLTAHYRRGQVPGDKTFWGVEAQLLANSRVYFLDGIEYAHPVAMGAFDLHLGRRLTDGLSLSFGLRAETVYTDSTSIVYTEDDFRGIEYGDEIEFEDLPAGIAAAVGERDRSIWRMDLMLDTRSRQRRAASPVSGLWGRLRTQYTLGEGRDYPSICGDLRTYRALGAGVLVMRGRAAAVGDGAPFYDRQYLGGLYTMRGFPSQSLSPPGGDGWMWHGSVEYRAPLLGDHENPRLAGTLFVDTGNSGDREGPSSDTALSAGWGFRIRLGWLGYMGADFAFPLSDSPVDDSARGHVSLDWNF